MAYFDPNEQTDTTLFVDASPVGRGSVLIQNRKANKEEMCMKHGQAFQTKMPHHKKKKIYDKMNPEKLKQLQEQVRIGGKGSARRKKKVVHRTATTDDKKLQSSLKKLSVSNIPGIEEVNMIKDDGQVLHFNNPKVQASLAANTFAINGHAENKQLTEMLPGILNQLGAESLSSLKKLASTVAGGEYLRGGGDTGKPNTEDIEDDDDGVPDLVENFDEASKDEGD